MTVRPSREILIGAFDVIAISALLLIALQFLTGGIWPLVNALLQAFR